MTRMNHGEHGEHGGETFFSFAFPVFSVPPVVNAFPPINL